MIDMPRLLSETCLRQAEWHDQVDSTNDRASVLAARPEIEMPLLIGADQQTEGRGRGANRWWGAEGSLMFSILVDMCQFGLASSDWPRFSLVTGLAVAETLATFLPSVSIGLKWPNDVWLGHRKASGILIEQCDQFPNRVVVGIGLNVNNSFVMAPEEQRRSATSMSDDAHGRQFDRTEILLDFLTRWRSLSQRLAEDDINLVEQWSRWCVLTGHPVMLSQGKQETIGVCAGIDANGALLLRTGFALERHYAGTVRLVQ